MIPIYREIGGTPGKTPRFKFYQKTPFPSPTKAKEKRRRKKNYSYREITASFWHTTLVGIPTENNAVKNNARSCHHSRSRHPVARAAAPAGGMVIAMGRVQVCFTPGARPPAEGLGRRSAHWHVPVSRHDRLLAARVPAADRDHRAPRTLCESSDSQPSSSPAIRRHLLLRRRIAANPGPGRRAVRQIRARRRPASPPPHADHPRSARRQAQRESCGRSQGKSASFRFRGRQSPGL